MGDTLKYNDNEREHVNFAQTLGMLQGRVTTGQVTKDTEHAYYKGVELLAAFPDAKGDGYFLKADCTGSGQTADGRSQNRIIVKVDSSGALVEGEAWVWRHDDRVLKLDAGFFKAAQSMRALIEK